MRFYTLSPNIPENPHLFPMWRPTFIAQGHSFVDRIEDCDIVLLDLHTRIAEYNQGDIELLCWGNKSLVTFCEWDRGSMSNDEWPYPLTNQQAQIFLHPKNGRFKTVHFCRLLDKTKTYPANLYSYEKPILYEEEPVTADQLFDRPYDICFIANSAPQRESIAKALLADKKLKCKISLGEKKIPFDDWVNEHRQAKLFVSASGGGFSNERPQHLFSISGMLQEKTNQLLLHPFTNSVNCVTISEHPTEQEMDYLKLVVNNKQELYKIYKGCIDHMKSFYTREYFANYVLSILKQENIL